MKIFELRNITFLNTVKALNRNIIRSHYIVLLKKFSDILLNTVHFFYSLIVFILLLNTRQSLS